MKYLTNIAEEWEIGKMVQRLAVKQIMEQIRYSLELTFSRMTNEDYFDESMKAIKIIAEEIAENYYCKSYESYPDGKSRADLETDVENYVKENVNIIHAFEELIGRLQEDLDLMRRSWDD